MVRTCDGLRYLKSTGNTHTQVNYDFNGQVITEEKLNGKSIVQQSTFVRGDRVLVKKDRTAGKDYYYLYNGHGDVVQMVDMSGNMVNSYQYDEWGNITSQTEGISTHLNIQVKFMMKKLVFTTCVHGTMIRVWGGF